VGGVQITRRAKAGGGGQAGQCKLCAVSTTAHAYSTSLSVSVKTRECKTSECDDARQPELIRASLSTLLTSAVDPQARQHIQLLRPSTTANVLQIIVCCC
jgi:hypothetical protein